LVAGELGYTVGSIYTSLTGYYTESGSGMVQLVTLARLLQKNNFQLWDFGMTMAYKVQLGGKEVLRADWLRTVLDLRNDERKLELKEPANGAELFK